jgi:hypothetical protein
VKPPRVEPYPNETKLSEGCQRRVVEVWSGAVLKIHGSAMQRRGEPDLLICVQGRLIAVELKQPGEVPTRLQMKRLRDWQKAGAIAGWATTEVELDRLLARAGQVGWQNPQLERVAAA